jgi:hypothetical protein
LRRAGLVGSPGIVTLQRTGGLGTFRASRNTDHAGLKAGDRVAANINGQRMTGAMLENLAYGILDDRNEGRMGVLSGSEIPG